MSDHPNHASTLRFRQKTHARLQFPPFRAPTSIETAFFVDFPANPPAHTRPDSEMSTQTPAHPGTLDRADKEG